jgi:hypothetical protein
VAWFYAVAQRESSGTLRGLVRWIPFLMAVGIGLSVNNARAVIEALRGRPSEFLRTPKYNLAEGESAATRRYRGRTSGDVWIEGALALYLTAAVVGAAWTGLWAAVPFLMLFQAGFLYTVATTLLQQRRAPAPP